MVGRARRLQPGVDDRAADRRARARQGRTSTSADAVGHGARLLAGGERLDRRASSTRGAFYAPTVLADVTPEMLISHEETFGPVAALAPFDTEDEAIALANDTVYGLAAYFHTRDYARLLRVAERLEYGIVGANCGLISAPNVPFGGVKESGYGREGGAFGIDEYLDVKYVLVGRRLAANPRDRLKPVRVTELQQDPHVVGVVGGLEALRVDDVRAVVGAVDEEDARVLDLVARDASVAPDGDRGRDAGLVLEHADLLHRPAHADERAVVVVEPVADARARCRGRVDRDEDDCPPACARRPATVRSA